MDTTTESGRFAVDDSAPSTERHRAGGTTRPARAARRVAALATVGVLAASGCGAAGSADSSTAGTTTPAPACRTDDGGETTSGPRVLRSQGVAATYTQVVPANGNASIARPLVVTFGSDSATGFDLPGTTVEPIVIHADEPRDVGAWSGDSDDLRLVEDLLLRAETELCHDTSSVFVTGRGAGVPVAAAAARHLAGQVRLIRVSGTHDAGAQV